MTISIARNSKARVIARAMLRRPLLTTHEVADLVKVTEPTVRTWIREGHLRGIHISREWRVAFKDLEDFLEARTTTVTTDHDCGDRSTGATANKENETLEGRHAVKKHGK